MKKAAQYTAEENTQDALKLSGMLYKLSALPFPTVALVHGNAFGGTFSIALREEGRGGEGRISTEWG